MVVEPSQKDLIGCQPEQILDRLAFLAKSVQFGVELDIDLSKQSAADDLPDEAENKVLSSLRDICRTNVDDGAADGLCRRNDDVVVFGHLESVEWLLCCRFVQDTGIDGIGYGVVDEFTQDKTISALIKELHGVGRDGQPVTNIRIAFQDLC